MRGPGTMRLYLERNLPLAERANLVVWRPSLRFGLVESLFLKMHLDHDKAFWCRYTFTRRTDHDTAYGALWAIFQRRGSVPVAVCNRFDPSEVLVGEKRFYVKIGPGELSMGRAVGSVGSEEHEVNWDLSFVTSGPSFVHLPHELLYVSPFPRNKIVSPFVDTRFAGALTVDGETYTVRDAKGMQGHNFGSSVAPFWVWSHCNVFDDETDVVFEAISSRLRVGPILSPPVSALYLRVEGEEFVFNSLGSIATARAKLRGRRYEVWARNRQASVHAVVEASMEGAVALGYVDSNGVARPCFNTSLCLATVELTTGGRRRTYRAGGTATLELGNKAAPPGVETLAIG